MANEGIAVFIGVAFAAIAAVGTFVYQKYQERQREQQYRQQYRYDRNEGPQNYKTRSPERPPPKQKGAKCGKCNLPLAGIFLEKFLCDHIFHDACVLRESICPFPGCGRKRKISSNNKSPERPPPKQKEAKCGKCNLSLAGPCLERLKPCGHIFHDACVLGVSICPFPGCGRKRKISSNNKSAESATTEQKGVNCVKCKLPLLGPDIRRLPCEHSFHSDCVLWVYECPFPGCREKVPESWP